MKQTRSTSGIYITLCGTAPWLEFGADDTEEGKLRAKMIDLTLRGLKNAVDPKSPDYLRFTENRHRQPLVQTFLQ